MERASPVGQLLLILACAGATVASALRLLGVAVPGVVLVALLVAVVALVGLGIGRIGAGVFGRPILSLRADRAGDRLAITFDDGPDPLTTPALLDLLERRGHRGTFFVIGRRAAEHPALLAEIARRGHGLGNHSFAHSWLGPARGPAALRADLDSAAATLEQATGARPRFYRPPMGILSPPVASMARQAGVEVVGWSTSAKDGIASATVAGSLRRLRRGLRPGAILVLHDGAERGDRRPIATALLPLLLDEIEARGLRSVTLDELLPPGLGEQA